MGTGLELTKTLRERITALSRPRRRRRLRNQRGATLVEFAIVAVPFFLILFGTMEIGFIFWGTYELDNATSEAAREIRTGQVQLGNVDEAGFRALVCNHVGLLAKCDSKLKVDVRSFNSFSQIAASQPDPLDADGNLNENFTFDPGGPGSIVLVSAFYQWPLINPSSTVTMSNMAGGDRLLRTSIAFRNEIFSSN